jgi:hypothetical protein
MFMRQHRIHGYSYTEVLESYRDPATGKPRHRVVVRWDAHYGRDVQRRLVFAKLMQRRALVDLRRAERWVRQLTSDPAPIDADEAFHAKAAARLARAERRLERERQRQARAAKLVDSLIEAEAGLGRSGKTSAASTGVTVALTAPATPP